MITAEGYKAFRGILKITPKNDSIEPFTMEGDWIYRPDTKCWYGCGRSFPETICEVYDTDKNNSR